MYTQHSPLLKEVLDEVLKGRPLDHLYPTVGSELPPFRRAHQEVIVFMIGGVTYEEALTVHNLNAAGYRIVLGSTTIHNSKTFLDEVMDATNSVPLKNRTLQAYHSPEGV